ncbi:MAG TPA: TPM domain-containing protein [Phenylobacterium sp.]|nr:TPM domain-containing protein [Phenylobacterium sp.]
MRLSALIAGLIALVLAGQALAAPTFPALTGRVVDAANILPPAEEAALDQRLAKLEADTSRQLVVATIPDLQGYEIEEYGYQLGRAWGIGEKDRDDGALLIVAPNDRKVRIEVGYGLEGVLTDALSSVILQTQVLPKFREGDMAGGVQAGVNAIEAQLRADPAAAAQAVAEANERPAKGGGFPHWIVVLVAIWIIFSMLPRFGRRRRRRSGLGALLPILVWEAATRGGGRGGGWSGGGGGWSGGGGGFSGGGGSFGGGGASGGW